MTGRAPGGPQVGMMAPAGLLDEGPDRARAFLTRAADAGVSHICCADHVSFIAGLGFDGLVHATVLAALHPALPVHTGIYLLPLRHPVLVARQLSDLARLAPGRLVFGVGVGGEDRHEVAVCGVDPASRGRRMEESLTVLRQLLTGTPVTFRGEFFQLDDALISPPADIPVVIGGRSDAAIRRAGRLGDGWLGIWASAARFAAAVQLAADEAGRSGRPVASLRHGMQVWCGLGSKREAARRLVATAMQEMYAMPFERFERYCPYGTPGDIAEFLAPYVEAGCSHFNLIAQAPDDDAAVEGVADVRRLLATA